MYSICEMLEFIALLKERREGEACGDLVLKFLGDGGGGLQS